MRNTPGLFDFGKLGRGVQSSKCPVVKASSRKDFQLLRRPVVKASIGLLSAEVIMMISNEILNIWPKTSFIRI